MKSIYKLLVLIFATGLFYQCSSDDGSNSQEQNVRLTSYSFNANEYNLTYNDQDRLTGLETSGGMQNVIYDANGQLIQVGIFSYTYNSQGRVAAITTPNGIDIAISYNNEGQMALLTSNTSPNSTSTSLEYNGTKLVSLTGYNSNNMSYARVTLTYDNDNIVQITEDRSSDGVNYVNRSVFSITYDSKNNPDYNVLNKAGVISQINTIVLHQSLRLIPSNSGGFINYYSKNNILSTQYANNLGDSEIETYDYVYDVNNYPISAEYERRSSDGNFDTEYYRTWTYETY